MSQQRALRAPEADNWVLDVPSRRRQTSSGVMESNMAKTTDGKKIVLVKSHDRADSAHKEQVKAPVKEPVKTPVKEPVKAPVKEPVKAQVKEPRRSTPDTSKGKK